MQKRHTVKFVVQDSCPSGELVLVSAVWWIAELEFEPVAADIAFCTALP